MWGWACCGGTGAAVSSVDLVLQAVGELRVPYGKHASGTWIRAALQVCCRGMGLEGRR